MTTPQQFVPTDQSSRDRIRDSLHETLFVEAGAGTGKTTSLVDRITSLVSTGTTKLDSIAAITFTEAAAAELRDRVRERMERAAGNSEIDAEQRQRCAQGVEDIDQASIQTLHSFATSLLQERPLEAGLPPAFEVMDDIEADLAFEERWTEWLDLALDNPALVGPLRLAMSLGLTLDDLHKLARAFQTDYDVLEGVEFPDTPPPTSNVAGAVMSSAREIERLLRCSRKTDDDPLYVHARGFLATVRRLDSDTEPARMYRILSATLPIRQGRGNKKDWDDDAGTGENACTALKGLLQCLDEQVTDELADARRSSLMPLVRAVQQFVLDGVARRKREGRAEFHDLLVWARDLLRDNIAVRDYFRHRFTHILIDEAQDTDPIQTEIAMYLAEAVAAGGENGGRPTVWTDVKPEPGKLFVVGDPKQSIYRFRRAEVRQMTRLHQTMGGETLRLVQNFRSQNCVLAWVNTLFEKWMQGEDQARYVAVTHRWESQTSHARRPRVWRLDSEERPRNVGAVRRQEAASIASLLNGIIAEGWQVLDSGETTALGQEMYRPARYSDICILMPQRTSLRMLELRMDDAGVPYRLEGASLIFNTQEVRDLLNCLRAIDDPADQVSLLGALRSPALACSDADLLAFVGAGGKLNYTSTPSPSTGEVRDEDFPPSPSTGEVRDEGFPPSPSTGEGRGGGEGSPTTGGGESHAVTPSLTLPRQEVEDRTAPPSREGIDARIDHVAEALNVVRGYHELRMWMPIPQLIEQFIRDRRLMEVAIAQRRPREQWRRYRFLVEQSRRFAESGGRSLRAFLSWATRQADENVRVTETPVPETDEEAVRVMTVHGAKGLEFPIVILTGLNSERNYRPNAALFDRENGLAEISLGTKDAPFRTEGYDRLAATEATMDEQERVRLMYVAATRARDHLVVSVLRTARDKDSAAARIAEAMEEQDSLWEPVPVPPAFGFVAPQTVGGAGRRPQPNRDDGPNGIEPMEHSMAARRQWEDERDTLLRDRRRASSVSATGLAKVAKDEAVSDEPWRRGRGGTSLGRAVHAVLQSIDLATGAGLKDTARAQATAEGLPGRRAEIERLVTAALEGSEVVKRAVRSGRIWREVPVAAQIGDSLIEGFIDLLFEEEGDLVIADYKTDSLDRDLVHDGPEMRPYRIQGGAYAIAVEAATGKRVKEVTFIFLRPQIDVPYTDIEAMKAEAMIALEGYLNQV